MLEVLSYLDKMWTMISNFFIFIKLYAKNRRSKTGNTR